MRGTDLRVRPGYVENYPSQDGDMHSQEATVHSQGLIGTQEHLWVLLGDGLFVPGTV